MASPGEGIKGPPGVAAAVERACGLTWNEFVELVIEIDTRMIAEGIPPKGRPLKVAFEIGRRQNRPVVLGPGNPTEILDAVHRIYELIYGKRNLQLGPAYVGALMIRDVFYEVFVPLIFGTVRFNFWDHVAELDRLQLNMFVNVDPEEFRLNTDQLIDIFDFGYALNDTAKLGTRWSELLHLAKEQIEGACRTLQGSFSHRVAVQGVAYAIELAGKALLSKTGLSESELEKIRHNLPKLVTEIIGRYPGIDHSRLYKAVAHIPYVIDERYKYSEMKRIEIGKIIRHGQFILGEFGRAISHYDARANMKPVQERVFP